jgi:hypothetical protein
MRNRAMRCAAKEDAARFPEPFGTDDRTLIESWDYVKIGEASHLVPVSAEFVFRSSIGRIRRVVVEYSNHRHFEAPTKLTYDKVN